MQNYIKILKKTPLFFGISEADLQSLSDCLGFYVRSYQKDALVMLADSEVTDVGVVLSGSVRVIKEDVMGNQSILAELFTTDLFAETFACAGIEKSPVTVMAAGQCEILFVKFRNMISSCTSACAFHTQLIENMLRLLASKNLMLQNKIELLGQRNIRDKLLHYFGLLMEQQKTTTVISPYNRTELADYLCVNRSAMSRELCKMRDEGLIVFEKDKFTIYTS